MKVLTLPSLEWLEFGNIYTGSVGDYRYRLAPNTKKAIVAVSRYSKYCFEKAQDVQTREFPLSSEGLTDLTEWLNRGLQEYQQ